MHRQASAQNREWGQAQGSVQRAEPGGLEVPLAGEQRRRERQRRHDEALTNTLGLAEQAAAAGNYADALRWLDVIEAIGDELPRRYRAARERWRALLDPRPVERRPAAPARRPRRRQPRPSRPPMSADGQ